LREYVEDAERELEILSKALDSSVVSRWEAIGNLRPEILKAAKKYSALISPFVDRALLKASLDELCKCSPAVYLCSIEFRPVHTKRYKYRQLKFIGQGISPTDVKMSLLRKRRSVHTGKTALFVTASLL